MYVMPTNDPAQQPSKDGNERQRIIARTLLRNFLVTPALEPQALARYPQIQSFKSHHGHLLGLKSDGYWASIRRATLHPKSVVVVLPDLEELLVDYPVLFKSSQVPDALKTLMEHILKFKEKQYQAGEVGRPPDGILQTLQTSRTTGHAVFIDREAYKTMARCLCWALADPEEGAYFLGFMNKDLYRNALRPPLPREPRDTPPPDGETLTKPKISPGASEWSETRNIVMNMLRAADCDYSNLNALYEHAMQTENYDFVAMIKQYQQELMAGYMERKDQHKGRSA